MPSIVHRRSPGSSLAPKRRPALVLGVAAAVLLAACGESGPTVPGPSAVVRVERSTRVLELHNRASEPLGYIVSEAAFATRADFAFCNDGGPECLRLPARGSTTVPYAEIAGYEEGSSEAIVYTWRVVPDGDGGHEVADLAAMRVGL